MCQTDEHTYGTWNIGNSRLHLMFSIVIWLNKNVDDRDNSDVRVLSNRKVVTSAAVNIIYC